MEKEKEDDGGGCSSVAEGSSVSPVDDGPHSHTQKNEKDGKGDVDEEIQVRARNRSEN